MDMVQKIQAKLTESMELTHLNVVNESHLHAGHAGDDGSGESHFKIEISSPAFDDIPRVARERLIYQCLADEIKQIHALSIKIT